ncbi:MAG: ANTAR domain-containing response regulator [Acidimicrobiales bacterium]
MALRVVIAEDEAIVRLDLREILQDEGYEVVADTGRGDEAIALVREHRPDLAILDVKMPGVDGLSAAREIGSENLAAVLILTAFSQRNLIEEARDAGVMAYLVKPFQAAELVPAIEMALGRYAEMQALTNANQTLEGERERLEEALETRRVLDRAKGLLMDTLGMRESDAFAFIQRSAMHERVVMREIARRVLEDGLRPPPSA